MIHVVQFEGDCVIYKTSNGRHSRGGQIETENLRANRSSGVPFMKTLRPSTNSLFKYISASGNKALCKMVYIIPKVDTLVVVNVKGSVKAFQEYVVVW